jgi:hypothetical protein
VYLHPKETLVPLTIENYTSHANIVTPDRGTWPATVANLEMLQQGPAPVRMTLDSSFDWTSPLGRSGTHACYVLSRRLTDTTSQIDFWYFFGYNPGYCPGCSPEGFFGAHQADWENITMIVSHPVDNIRRHQIEKVFFSSHGVLDGYWKRAEDCEFETFNNRRRLVVYSALNSHGFYHQPGVWFRMGCVANDYTGRGMPILGVPKYESPWLRYDFDWGNWSCSTPQMQELVSTSNTCCRRFWFCCKCGDAECRTCLSEKF